MIRGPRCLTVADPMLVQGVSLTAGHVSRGMHVSNRGVYGDVYKRKVISRGVVHHPTFSTTRHQVQNS